MPTSVEQQDTFCLRVQAEVVRLLGGGPAFVEFTKRHPSFTSDLWGFGLLQCDGPLTAQQVAAIWYARRVEPQLASDEDRNSPGVRYLQEGREDLAAARSMALLLRNMVPSMAGTEDGEDPVVQERRNTTDGDDPDDAPIYECCVYVGGDEVPMCIVPAYYGQTMRDVADAIAGAGRTILSLLEELERTRLANQALLAWRNGQSNREGE